MSYFQKKEIVVMKVASHVDGVVYVIVKATSSIQLYRVIYAMVLSTSLIQLYIVVCSTFYGQIKVTGWVQL